MEKLFFRVRPTVREDGTINADGLWCVCWYGESEDYGWEQHKGDPVERQEAERRVAWGRRTYPELIYWLEPAK